MIIELVIHNFKGILNANSSFNKDRNVILGNSGAGKSTIIEAKRSGCIAIVSDARHGSLDAITDDKNGIVVKQGSARAIVNALTDIIQHPENISISTRQVTITTSRTSHVTFGSQTWNLPSMHHHLMMQDKALSTHPDMHTIARSSVV